MTVQSLTQFYFVVLVVVVNELTSDAVTARNTAFYTGRVISADKYDPRTYGSIV